MAKELTGPYAREITELNAELARFECQFQDVRLETQMAIESRDLAKLIELRAVRDAIPEIIKAISTERERYLQLRQAEITRQSVSEHEARFDELPKHETITNPNDPNSKTMIVRTRM